MYAKVQNNLCYLYVMHVGYRQSCRIIAPLNMDVNNVFYFKYFI